jgi:putative transposon-encoded protein
MKKYSAFMAGILGFLLVFGFALTACDSGGDDDSNKTDDSGSSNPFLGTWSGREGFTLTIGASDWTIKENTQEYMKGTYTHSGNSATLTVTHYWDEEKWVAVPEPMTGSATVSGSTLTVTLADQDPQSFTKQ